MLVLKGVLHGGALFGRTCGGLIATVRLNSTGNLVENTVKVTGLGSLYTDWAKLKPQLPRIPAKDITLDLPYIRLQSNSSDASAQPLRIVAFHGSPGGASDFNQLAEALGKKAKVDFIAPTFPDLNFSLKNRMYWHSAEEKMALAEILLEKIGVNEVDIAIGHSAGSYPAVLMSLYATKIKAKSVVLVASTGFRILPVIQPEWLMTILTRWLWMPPLEKFVFGLLNTGMKFQSVGKMTAYDALSSLATQYATVFWAPNNGPRWCRDLENNRVPRIVIFGMKDKLVPPRYNKGLTEDMGNPDEKTHWIYEGKSEPEAKLVSKPLPTDLPPVVAFREGGHFVFQQYPDVIAQHILDFSRKALKK